MQRTPRLGLIPLLHLLVPWGPFLLLAGCGSPRPPLPPPSPLVEPASAGPLRALAPRGHRLRLTILSTNDFHGQLESLRRFTDEEPPRSYRVGGAEALAATIAELRAADPEGTLLLDGGDFMQGSLIANHFEGAPVRDVFGLLGYDAVAIGNHELDYGPVGVPDPPPASGADPRGALRAWCSRAPFPVLSANLRGSDGAPLPWRNLHGSVLVRRRGILVGLIGLTTPETVVTTMPAFAEGLRFDAWLPVVRRESAWLRSRGAEVVVLLAHGTAECPRRDSGSCRGELFAELLDKLEPGLVDVVVAGHSHQPIAHRYRDVLVVEACSRGQVVGRVELWIDAERRRLLTAESRVLPPAHVCHDVFQRSGDCEAPTDAAGAQPDPIVPSPLLAKHRALLGRVDQALAAYQRGIAGGSRRVLAHAARPLLNRRAAVSQVGAFFAEALLRAVPGADAAVVNGGGTRADLPSGDIRYADLYQAFPFDNRLATVRLTGAELTRLVEQLLTRYGLPLLAGLQLHLRCGPPRRLAGILDARGLPIRASRLFTLVLNDFLLTGGDGLGPVLEAVPADRKHVYPHTLVREVLARYLERQRTPINSDTHPVISTQHPPVVFEDGPCRTPGRRRPLSFCH